VLQYTNVPCSVSVLKKNVSETGDVSFDYGKGIYFYEELHHHLVQCSRNNHAYTTGMEIIFRYGLKYFLNKFKRKETVFTASRTLPAPVPPKADGMHQDTDSSRELVFLLAEMIQSAGSYYGIE
jgi:hypothetical protein